MCSRSIPSRQDPFRGPSVEGDPPHHATHRAPCSQCMPASRTVLVGHLGRERHAHWIPAVQFSLRVDCVDGGHTQEPLLLLGCLVSCPGLPRFPGHAMASEKGSLFRPHEPAFRTQYAELKKRIRSTEFLLPGSPGTLVKRSTTERSYWYRAYQEATGKRAKDFVCRDSDKDRYEQAVGALEFAKWMGTQVRTLRKLQFQVTDKGVACVLVELPNSRLLVAGLCVVGTRGYMTWLNELGPCAVTARTQGIDLTACQGVKLAAPKSFLDVMAGTNLGFHPVPGLSHGLSYGACSAE